MDWTMILSIAIPALVVILGKFIPNTAIRKFAKGLGLTVTLGAARWIPKWNKTVEPYIIDQIDHFIGGFCEGLRSDTGENE